MRCQDLSLGKSAAGGEEIKIRRSRPLDITRARLPPLSSIVRRCRTEERVRMEQGCALACSAGQCAMSRGKRCGDHLDMTLLVIASSCRPSLGLVRMPIAAVKTHVVVCKGKEWWCSLICLLRVILLLRDRMSRQDDLFLVDCSWHCCIIFFCISGLISQPEPFIARSRFAAPARLDSALEFVVSCRCPTTSLGHCTPTPHVFCCPTLGSAQGLSPYGPAFE